MCIKDGIDPPYEWVGKGNEYTNSVSHIKSKHLADWENFTKLEEDGPLEVMKKVSGDVKEKWEYLEFIVNTNTPLKRVGDSSFKRVCRLKPISRHTMRRILVPTANQMCKTIMEELPLQVGLIFDGWSHHGRHYLGVFANFDGQRNGKPVMLGLVEFNCKFDFTSDSHIATILELLAKYNFNWKNILFIVTDNPNVNRSIAIKVGLPMIPCFSHRLNTAVQEYINSSQVNKNLRTCTDDGFENT